MKFYNFIKLKPLEVNSKYGGIAQMARAWDSYPQGRWFESTSRYNQHDRATWVSRKSS